MNFEIQKRVEWIKNILETSGAKGVVVGNSGGKDCALVLILCKLATDNVLSVIIPCQSKQNYTTDRDHAKKLCEVFNIDCAEVDISAAKVALQEALAGTANTQVAMAFSNINPRLRMTTLYTIAQSKGYLVAGTGNLSEYTMGYFTKWGDGAFDFNPIADLTATEVFDALRELNAPPEIINKPPSAGLYDGQTDEAEMGVSYAEIDKHIRGKKSCDSAIIEATIMRTQHKRNPQLRYPS